MVSKRDAVVYGDIVAGNIRAVQSLYFAQQLDRLRMFEVVDRLLQLFQQGQLPLGAGAGNQRMERVMRRYLAHLPNRLSVQERNSLYCRTLGAPGGDEGELQTNREFQALWLRFIASVALVGRQPQAAGTRRPSAKARALAWRAARALAANASAQGAGLTSAVSLLAADANAARAVLQAPDVQRAFGARDMWQVIDEVARLELGGAVNVRHHRSLAQSGSSILQHLAERAAALHRPAPPADRLAFPGLALTDAVEDWLVASVIDVDGAGGNCGDAAAAGSRAPALPSPAPGTVALFCGAAGTGKTLAAHALAAALSRDLLRVDLRGMVSQHVGETEQRLDAAFAEAERAGALLLFDEADALFGRRTEVLDAHDRYANLAIDHLLQRLEAFEGIAILMSNRLPATTDDERLLRLCHVLRFPRL